MSNSSTSFLGTGWSFPPTFVKGANTIVMVSDEEDIKESLRIILSTRIGERVLNPNFGCELDRLLFESINTSLISLVKEIIDNSLLMYEPRIRAENISIITDQQLAGVLQISIDYTIISTNSRNNLVFPFYLNEGTNISQ